MMHPFCFKNMRDGFCLIRYPDAVQLAGSTFTLELYRLRAQVHTNGLNTLNKKAIVLFTLHGGNVAVQYVPRDNHYYLVSYNVLSFAKVLKLLQSPLCHCP